MGDVNIWAVLAAAATSFPLGGLWYSQVLFLGAWARAAGREPLLNGQVFAVTGACALVAAGGFAVWLGPHPPLGTALLRGLTAGLCFAATSLAINYAFAARGLTLWLIDSGFHVARFVLFALVLSLWPW